MSIACVNAIIESRGSATDTTDRGCPEGQVKSNRIPPDSCRDVAINGDLSIGEENDENDGSLD